MPLTRFILNRLLTVVLHVATFVVVIAMSAPMLALTLKNPYKQASSTAVATQDQIVEARSAPAPVLGDGFGDAAAHFDHEPDFSPVDEAEGEGFSNVSLDEILHPSHSLPFFLTFRLDSFPDHRLLSLISLSSAPELDPPRSA